MTHTNRQECDAGLRIGDFDGAIFDLDGVVTRTDRLHANSWKRLFDAYLARRSRETGGAFVPFDKERDYRRYVDGKPRHDGVVSFLKSRDITLPRGDPADPPDRETICGLANRKNGYFRDALRQEGVETFDDVVTLIHRLRNRDVKVGLVSSSRNARAVLEASNLTDLFDTCIDGIEAARRNLQGKPKPDLFLAAAKDLGVEPSRALVFEDAISGVMAARAGGFALVVALDRANQGEALREAGADMVTTDISSLHIRWRRPCQWRGTRDLPSILERPEDIRRRLDNRQVALFLDYDGTLTPIVARPELALLTEEMRAEIKALAGLCTVAIVSGRDRLDVERLVGLKDLVYAGSHGFDISGPGGLDVRHEEGAAFTETVRRAAAMLSEILKPVEGALVEPKRFGVAVHYRQVAESEVSTVEAAVDHVLKQTPALRKTYGKKVYELRPRLEWDKGKAVLWVLKALGLDEPDVLPIYLGDDTTDEDAFAALADHGITIRVGSPVPKTAAHYVLRGPEDVSRFLQMLAALLKENRHA